MCEYCEELKEANKLLEMRNKKLIELFENQRKIIKDLLVVINKYDKHNTNIKYL